MRTSRGLPNDLRISCKREASRPHNHYVPLATSALAARAELYSDALVGCMRGLGAEPDGLLTFRSTVTISEQA
jgi:hypothetical protein